MPTPASFLFIFGLIKPAIQFLQEINVKNVHPIYGARIQTMFVHCNLNCFYLYQTFDPSKRILILIIISTFWMIKTGNFWSPIQFVSVSNSNLLNHFPKDTLLGRIVEKHRITWECTYLGKNQSQLWHKISY